jgi:hypothetical protein
MARVMTAQEEIRVRVSLQRRWNIPDAAMPDVMNAVRRDVWAFDDWFPRVTEVVMAVRAKETH